MCSTRAASSSHSRFLTCIPTTAPKEWIRRISAAQKVLIAVPKHRDKATKGATEGLTERSQRQAIGIKALGADWTTEAAATLNKWLKRRICSARTTLLRSR